MTFLSCTYCPVVALQGAEGRLHAERSQFEYENDLFEGGFSDEEDEIFRKMHEYD